MGLSWLKDWLRIVELLLSLNCYSNVESRNVALPPVSKLTSLLTFMSNTPLYKDGADPGKGMTLSITLLSVLNFEMDPINLHTYFFLNSDDVRQIEGLDSMPVTSSRNWTLNWESEGFKLI
jgi:hypothetical protein